MYIYNNYVCGDSYTTVIVDKWGCVYVVVAVRNTIFKLCGKILYSSCIYVCYVVGFFSLSQRLDEAEESYVKALQLDPNYKDAEEELFKIRLEQLNVCLHIVQYSNYE